MESGYNRVACFHPITAYRTTAGAVIIAKEPADAHPLSLPCGNCLGCRMAAARAWALRCQLELSDHRSATFTTLTYDDDHLPVTLSKRHLQLWLKRFRKKMAPTGPVRFFASGEYGELNNRPHYHAILYGANADRDRNLIQDTWAQGHTKTVDATPATIAYVAGYTAKKIGFKRKAAQEQVDQETGEVYTWEAPFIQMSRRPGIGGLARQHTASWRSHAVHNGAILPTPRFLHQAWKNTATQEDLETLEYEKQQHRKHKTPITKEGLKKQEQIAQAKQQQQTHTRKL